MTLYNKNSRILHLIHDFFTTNFPVHDNLEPYKGLKSLDTEYGGIPIQLEANMNSTTTKEYIVDSNQATIIVDFNLASMASSGGIQVTNYQIIEIGGHFVAFRIYKIIKITYAGCSMIFVCARLPAN